MPAFRAQTSRIPLSENATLQSMLLPEISPQNFRPMALPRFGQVVFSTVQHGHATVPPMALQSCQRQRVLASSRRFALDSYCLQTRVPRQAHCPIGLAPCALRSMDALAMMVLALTFQPKV